MTPGLKRPHRRRHPQTRHPRPPYGPHHGAKRSAIPPEGRPQRQLRRMAAPAQEPMVAQPPHPIRPRRHHPFGHRAQALVAQQQRPEKVAAAAPVPAAATPAPSALLLRRLRRKRRPLLLEHRRQPKSPSKPPQRRKRRQRQNRRHRSPGTEKVAARLITAEENLRAGRITKPKRRNALADYLTVLAMDRDNPAAHSGVEHIVELYVAKARQATQARSWTRPTGHLRQARFVLDAMELRKWPPDLRRLVRAIPGCRPGAGGVAR